MKIKSFLFYIIVICLIFMINSCTRSGIYSKTKEIHNISSSNAITDYKFLKSLNPALSTDVVSIINENAKTIDLIVPFGTDVTNLIATFVTDGETVEVNSLIQESGLTSNNFSTSVTYTVTAEDNASIADYAVIVTIAPSNAKAFTQFQFSASLNASLSIDVTGVIDENNKTIDLTVPYDADPTNLKATFSITGKQVEISSVIQDSGITSNNFSSPITYTVVADDNSTVNYTVTVVVQFSPEKAITSFKFTKAINTNLTEDVIALINETDKTIDFDVPMATDVSSLVATFITTGTGVEVGGIVQTSSVTENNFTSSVLYDVTAEDSSTATYVATVNFVLYSDNFDDNTYTGWTEGTDGSSKTMVSPGANGSDYCLYQSVPSTTVHGQGLYKSFANLQPTYISWYVKFTSLTLAHGYVTATDASGRYIFWFYGMGGATFGMSPGPTAPTTVDKWYLIEIKNINFTTKTYDYFIDGSLHSSSVAFRDSGATDLSKINLYNYQAADAYWDQLVVE